MAATGLSDLSRQPQGVNKDCGCANSDQTKSIDWVVESEAETSESAGNTNLEIPAPQYGKGANFEGYTQNGSANCELQAPLRSGGVLWIFVTVPDPGATDAAVIDDPGSSRPCKIAEVGFTLATK